MLVKELIQMLKSNGIKGNSKIEIDSVNDVNINGYVIVEINKQEIVILTDNVEEVNDNHINMGFEVLDYKYNGELSYREKIKLGQVLEDPEEVGSNVED